jgi:hypothetical protein
LAETEIFRPNWWEFTESICSLSDPNPYRATFSSSR